MDYIHNGLVLDEDLFFHCPYTRLELTEEQRKQLEEEHVVKLLDGSIIISIPMSTKEDTHE